MPQVNANELTFGVEIECYVPENAPITAGSYHAGRQIRELPQGWNAQSDCSLRHEVPEGYKPVEIVSPVLKGEDGLRQVKAVCEWLNSMNAKVRKSCGFHVHVGVPRGDEQLLRKLAFLVANHEKALFAATGTKHREESHYCRGIQEDTSYTRVMRDGQTSASHRLERYHVLNLTNVLHGGKPTAEFRVFAGTTNPVKTAAYVRICLALVEKAHAMKKFTKWTAKTTSETSPIYRKGGHGQTELTRLFYAIGWIHGRESHTFGAIQGEGLPTVEECKAELKRLAKKYDETQG